MLSIVPVLAGCYDRTETEDRRYVVLMGIDSGENKNLLSMDFDILGDNGDYVFSIGEAKLENAIEKDSEEQITTVVAENTFPEMKKLADKHSDRKIYFGQLKAAVLAADIASDKDRLLETVYNIERMEDINTKVVVFASEGFASDTVETVMKNDEKGGLYLWDYYRNNYGNEDEYMDFEKLVKYLREEETFILPRLVTDGDEVTVSGGMVIKNGEYVGRVNDEDINGIKWFKGKAKGELISIDGISAIIKKENVDIGLENGVGIVSVKAYCAIESGDSEDTNYWEEKLETVIKNKMENTINKARDLNADFIGITNDGILGSRGYKLDVDVKIISTGIIK